MGKDIFREKLRNSLAKSGVRLTHVLTDPAAPTGVALIGVDSSAENEITVVSGSNMKLLPSDVRRRERVFRSVGVVLLQLEVPVPTVLASAELGARSGALVVLNPAPARKLPQDLLRRVDYLTPNETEAELLSGVPVHSLKSAAHAAGRLIRKGAGNVIVTMGARGALLVTPESASLFPSPRVRPVDTVAAGDAFNGALAGALAAALPLEEAVTLACAVGAFSVTRRGAQTSMPSAAELRAFMTRRFLRRRTMNG